MLHYQNLSLENLKEKINRIVYNEEWKDIVGYEGLYMVSSFGRVKSVERISKRPKVGDLHLKERILKQGIAIKRGGYLIVSLQKQGKIKSFWVHRLVAQHFIKNPENKATVNHKKGIVKDSRMWELEWNTFSENSLHSFKVLNRISGHQGKTKSKSPLAKRVYCITNGKIYNCILDIVDELKLQQSSISLVCNGKRNHTGGYKFKFL